MVCHLRENLEQIDQVRGKHEERLEQIHKVAGGIPPMQHLGTEIKAHRRHCQLPCEIRQRRRDYALPVILSRHGAAALHGTLILPNKIRRGPHDTGLHDESAVLEQLLHISRPPVMHGGLHIDTVIDLVQPVQVDQLLYQDHNRRRYEHRLKDHHRDEQHGQDIVEAPGKGIGHLYRPGVYLPHRTLIVIIEFLILVTGNVKIPHFIVENPPHIDGEVHVQETVEPVHQEKSRLLEHIVQRDIEPIEQEQPRRQTSAAHQPGDYHFVHPQPAYSHQRLYPAAQEQGHQVHRCRLVYITYHVQIVSDRLHDKQPPGYSITDFSPKEKHGTALTENVTEPFSAGQAA